MSEDSVLLSNEQIIISILACSVGIPSLAALQPDFAAPLTLPGKTEVFGHPSFRRLITIWNSLHPYTFGWQRKPGSLIMEYRPRRAMSPGSRRIFRGGSSSTGTLIHPSAFDPYHGPSRSSTGFALNPRSSAVGAPRVLPRYRAESPPRQPSREDHVIRPPRRESLSIHNPAPGRPLSYIPPSSPSRSRPIITSAVDKPPSPSAVATRPRYAENYFVLPSSSSSRRESGRNYTFEGDYQARDRWELGGYRRTGGSRGVYNVDPPYFRSHGRDERDPGYEYTDWREQAYRDSAPRPRPRTDGDTGRRARANSMAGLENYGPRINLSGRDPGPPVAMDNRGFHAGERSGLDRSGSLVQSHRRSDNELPREYKRDEYDTSQSRKSSQMPVVHQDHLENYPAPRREVRDATEVQPRKHGAPSMPEPRKEIDRAERFDEQYDRTNDARSTRYDDRERHRGHEREGPDHHRAYEREGRDYGGKEDGRARGPGSGQEISENELIALAAANAAGAGVLADKSRSRQHRHNSHRDDDDPAPGRTRDDDRGHRTKREDSQNGSSNATTDDSGDEKRGRREKHRRQPPPGEDEEFENRKEVEPLAPSDENADDEPSRENLMLNELVRAEKPSRSGNRHHRHYSRTRERDSFSEDSISSGGQEARQPRDSREKKTRQVRVVTPSEDPHEPEPPIKGILRPPREKFPEDPAPVREGVAPLNKKGIPPNARWTKIDRKLVNPEALEAGNERYEGRSDYVIVLRVLTKEDIEEYALKTQEIRAKRGIPPNTHESR